MTRHPFDPVSFLGGLVLLLVGTVAAFGGLSSVEALGVVGPAILLVLGLALVASTVVGVRTPPQEDVREPGQDVAATADAHGDGDG